MKKYWLLYFLSLTLNSYSQNTLCDFDHFYKNAKYNDPALQQKENELSLQLYNAAISRNSSERTSSVIRNIPVVVHIVHEFGPENMSDSSILAILDKLNLQMLNASPFNYPNGSDTQIQFCLASVDPFGNPTSGITRTVSPLTNLALSGSGFLDLYNLSRWDPHLYLNVWVIRSTGFSAPGWASFPTMMGSGIDGIMLQYNVLDQFLVHEVGHWLGLHHTFYAPIVAKCVNFNCLLDGDQICDTPPDTSELTYECSVNTCMTEMNDTSGVNPFITDVNDVQSYMDYSLCPFSFTAGQSARMNDVLTFTRNTLLQSNGCGANPGGPVPVASFTHIATCGGTYFTNTSLNSVGAQWDFTGDGIADDAGNTITYNAPVTGYYNVTMIATGYGGVDTSATQVVFIQHYPYQNYPLVNGYGGLVISPTTNLLTACEGDTVYFQGEPGMASYNWSNGDTTQNTVFVQGTSPFSMTLSTVDSAGLTWSSCYPVEVAAAPATIPPTVTVTSSDSVFCIGSEVDLAFTYSPDWYSGNFYHNNGSITGFHDSTHSPILALSNYFYVTQTDINGCTSSSDPVFIIAQSPTNPANLILLGNNILYSPGGTFFQWYFNGAPITGANAATYQMTMPGCYKVFYWWFGAEACGTFSLDSVCITTVGMEENIPSQNDFYISPNPFSSTTTIVFTRAQKDIEIRISDVMGRLIKTVKFSGKELMIDKESMQPGIYLISIFKDDQVVGNRKIILR